VASYGGELTPEQLAADARALGLDFIATTEHNTAEVHGRWSRYAGADLLVILGQEVVTRTGHWLALGIAPGQLVDWRYGYATMSSTAVWTRYIGPVGCAWRPTRTLRGGHR
jgi:hypothetical protein